MRPDVQLSEIIMLVGGIAKIHATDPQQIERMVEIALDGLRYRS